MQRITKECPQCKKHISLSNFNKHITRCIDGIIIQKHMPKKECENCGNEFNVSNYNTHYNACLQGYVRQPIVGLGPQNQHTKAKRLGLPKPIISEETRNKLSEKCGKCVWTDEMRKSQSDHAKRRGIGGKFINNRIEYKDVKLGSGYELKVAISLDENNIIWEKPKSFEYTDPNGKNRKYTPDFYLPEYDVYLDPKNDFLINNVNPAMGFSDITKIELVEIQNSIKVFILDKTQLSWYSILKMINFATALMNSSDALGVD